MSNELITVKSEHETINKEKIKKDIFKEYLTYLVVSKGYSEKTIEAYTNDLIRYDNYCNNNNIDPEKATHYEVQKFIEDLSMENMASVSVNRSLSAVRGFYKWMLRFNKRENTPCSRIKNVKLPKKIPSVLWENEMSGFAYLPETTGILWPVRDKALILAMYSGGLRISEIVSLSMYDISHTLEDARIMGKGGKMRYVFFSDQTIEALKEYLPQRNARLAMLGIDKNNKSLFISRKGKSISVPGVRWIISRYAQASGIGKKIHPHSLRHSFATHMVKSGCDVRSVQEMLGHASISTTQRYTHITLQNMMSIYNDAHPHA